MKLNKYSWLAVLPMIFTACQEDTLVKEQQQDKIYTISATMDGGAASRAQIVIGNDADASAGEIFMWNEGDSFDMYQNVDDAWEKSTFTISNYSETGEGEKTTAMFKANKPATAGAGFMAFYPANELNSGVDHYLPTAIDFTTETDAWKNYFKSAMLMKATSESLDAENPIVEFQHLCSLARITYTNKTGTDQSISYFCLNGHEPNAFGTSYNYNVRNGDSGGDTADRCGLEVNGLTVPYNESVDLYLLFFPKEFVTDGKLQVIIKHPSIGEEVNQKSTPDMNVSTIAEFNDNATGFEAGKRYWFKVTETAEGLLWSKDYEEKPAVDETIVIDNIPLSKALYEVYSGQYEMTLNSDEKLEIKQSEILKFHEIHLGWRGYSIPTLDGIENFVELTSLGLGSVGLQSCNLSKNTKLIDLNVSWNQLEKLDLSNNPNLIILVCEFNEDLSELIFSDKAKLGGLNVGNTALTELNIPDPSNIDYLYYGHTSISLTTLEGFTSLTMIDNSGMGLTDLLYIPDSLKKNIIYLSCSDNNISTLDMDKFPVLQYLHCNNNKLTSLDLSKQTSLHSLQCMGNQIEYLDITNTNLKSTGNCLNVGKQQGGEWLELKVTQEQKEAWVNGWKNQTENAFVFLEGEEPEEMITIDNASFAQELKNQYGDDVTLKDGKAIMTKTFAENNVTEIHIWGNRDVTSLEGIKNFPNLKRLILVYNGLASLDVSGLSKLEYLECWDGSISSLNVSGCTALKELYCQTNALTELDVTDCINITNLNCEDNKLTSLDLTKCTNERINLLCGNQGEKAKEEITITIKLTEAMKTYWKQFLFDEGKNDVRVLVDGFENMVSAPSISKENW